MQLTSFSRYPRINAELHPVSAPCDLAELIQQHHMIARGMGRSYGDSALAPHVVTTESLNRIVSFNQHDGVLCVQSGVSLGRILDHCVTQGWFLGVTPGTQFVSVGGAIASDVHGKNHHLHGCFSEYLLSMDVMVASGEVITCSREQHVELFYATCGGMGLTGIIMQAQLRLIPISSSLIARKMIKTRDLSELLAYLDQSHNYPYSVAWLDATAHGKKLGRGLLMLGQHVAHDQLAWSMSSKHTVPRGIPGWLLNGCSVKAFNLVQYHHQKNHSQQIGLLEYFYPLDALLHWNRLYGRQGPLQYQCVIEDKAALKQIVQAVHQHACCSPLVVLKQFGEANHNYLSFPKKGWTLSLDFKVSTRVLALLEHLDRIVLQYGGRVYLTKDARMSEAFFKQTYPNWEQFLQVKGRYDPAGRFRSLQAQRLGLVL